MRRNTDNPGYAGSWGIPLLFRSSRDRVRHDFHDNLSFVCCALNSDFLRGQKTFLDDREIFASVAAEIIRSLPAELEIFRKIDEHIDWVEREIEEEWKPYRYTWRLRAWEYLRSANSSRDLK